MSTQFSRLTGDVPNPVNLPAGCRFQTCCRCKLPRSIRTWPTWGGGHWLACHLGNKT